MLLFIYVYHSRPIRTDTYVAYIAWYDVQSLQTYFNFIASGNRFKGSARFLNKLVSAFVVRIITAGFLYSTIKLNDATVLNFPNRNYTLSSGKASNTDERMDENYDKCKGKWVKLQSITNLLYPYYQSSYMTVVMNTIVCGNGKLN